MNGYTNNKSASIYVDMSIVHVVFFYSVFLLFFLFLLFRFIQFNSTQFYSKAYENFPSGTQEAWLAKYTHVRDSLGIKAVSKVS